MNSPCSKCVVYAICEKLCDKAQDKSAIVDKYSIEIYNRNRIKLDRIIKELSNNIEKALDSMLTGKKL